MKMRKLLPFIATTAIATSMFGFAASADDFNITVNLASEPQTMDPQKNTTLDGGTMMLHLFEGLMTWEDSGEEQVGSDGTCDSSTLTYGQAESYDREENEDGTVSYTFHLRDGIKWSDGVPVTANDFAYAWRRLVDPNTAADYSYMIANVVNAQDIIDGKKDPSELGVEAVDDKTFKVTLSTDLSYFEELCAFPALMPVREDIIEANGDQWTYDVDTYVSNGPYKMTDWTHNSEIVVAKNDEYYGAEELGPDTITFKLMDDQNAMLSGFNSGELNFIEDVPQAEITSLVASGDLKILDYIGTYFVCFNNEQEPFDNPLVREAFTLAIDRTYIVEKVTQQGQVEAGGFVPYGVYDADGATGDDFRTVGGDYYAPTDADYEANCEKAKELLAEALQFMWEDVLGVTVTLNNQEWVSFIDSRKKGDYSIARHGWIADYNDPMTFIDMWETGGGNNDAKYSNADYDALLDQIRGTMDQGERMKLMHEAEDLVIGQDYGVCPLYFYTQKYMLSDGIKGLHYTTLGYFFFGHTSAE